MIVEKEMEGRKQHNRFMKFWRMERDTKYTKGVTTRKEERGLVYGKLKSSKLNRLLTSLSLILLFLIQIWFGKHRIQVGKQKKQRKVKAKMKKCGKRRGRRGRRDWGWSRYNSWYCFTGGFLSRLVMNVITLRMKMKDLSAYVTGVCRLSWHLN